MTARGGALAAAAVAALCLTLGSPGGEPGVQTAPAAIRKAVGVSAASADQSGTAVVRITHNGELWGGNTIRLNGADLAVSSNDPGRKGRVGRQLLLVDGMMYGTQDGAWVELGPPESVDPDSGTTPAEYLAAVREAVSGELLRRINGGVTEVTTRGLSDGSNVYSALVPAGLIARETGFKGGRAIRVLPFGYVAHGEAADPTSLLRVAMTVETDDVVRELTVRWGSGASTWTFSVAYSGLGATPAPIAPANARSLRERLRFHG